MKKLILFILMLTVYASLFSQTGTINGNVKDRQTNEPLPGATVIIKGRTGSTTTDNLGNFKFLKVDTGNVVIVISYVGYNDMVLQVNVADGNISTRNASLSLIDQVGNAVVVSASKRPEKITDAPASIQVIGKKELEEFAGSNFGELISKVQGIEYVRTGVDETYFNARGFNSAFNNKVLHIADGRNSMTALSGGLPIMNRGTATKDDIDRLEVVVGPQSALYGPNAHNAVFNFITKDPRKYQGTTLGVSAGNRNQFSARFRHATKIDERWAFKLTGEYVSGTEYVFYDSVYGVAPNRAIPEHNVDFDFRHVRGEGHLYYSITPTTDVIVSGGGSTNNYLQVTTGMRNQIRGLTYNFLQARITNPHYYVTIYNTWGNIGTSYPIVGYTRDFWRLTHNPSRPISIDSAEKIAIDTNMFKERSQRFNADGQYNHNFQKVGLFLVAGLNYQNERPNGFGINLVDSFEHIVITQYGAVLQLEKKLPWRMRLIAAARWDNHSNFGNVFAPKIGLIKSVADGNLRITWARAFAMPSILFQFSNLNNSTFGNGAGVTYVPNGKPDEPSSYKVTTPLKPEEVKTLEAGYKGTILRRLFIDVSGYYSQIRNFLGPSKTVPGRAKYVGDIAVYPNSSSAGTDQNGLVQNAQFTTYFNYGQVKAWGIDAGLNYRFNNFVSLGFKYSWFDSDIKKDDPENDANKDGEVTEDENSLNAPNSRGLIMLSFQNLFKNKAFINLSTRFVQRYNFYSGAQIGSLEGEGRRGIIERDSLPDIRKNFDHGPLGGFITIDLSAGYRLNQQVQLNMGITNLFNTKQTEFVGSPSISRLIVFELKLHVPNKKKQ